jgi:hypothetical protein
MIGSAPFRFASSLAIAAVISVLAVPEAKAESAWRRERGEAHGSQVASSDWLPIVLGGAAGVVVGGLTGAAFDRGQPAVVGPVGGAAIGGLTGGAAGAWLIRSVRDKDTRLAGTLTGLGVGTGVGIVLFTRAEPNGRALETVGKWSALVIAPVVGAVVGHRLAVVFGGKKDEPAPMPIAVRPSIAPVVAPAGNAAGWTFGLDGAF